MATPYSRTKVPAAPVLPVRLSAPGESAGAVLLSALVDTGSDFTLVSLARLQEVEAPQVRGAYARGLWSEPHPVPIHLVDLHFDTGTLPGIEVIGLALEEGTAADRDEVILGRNALNRLMLLLDGPREECELLERRTSRR